MLSQILESTAARVEQILPNAAGMAERATAMAPGRGLAAALTAPGLQVVAEIKRRSPSVGVIDTSLNPATQAALYEAGGAAAISVLTEPQFFSGSLSDLTDVRQAVTVPVLRKDFIIHEAQIAEAKIAGADAVLLIVAALSPRRLGELLDVASGFGLDALVEVHTADELVVANQSGARLVGVNNRDLHTFVTDLATAERLAASVAAPVRVAESGVSSPAGAARMAAAGYDAILVGEALVRSADPAALVAALRNGGTA